MIQHFEILSKTSNGKRTFWTRIGTAFYTKDGRGLRLKLNYYPTAPETQIMVLPVHGEEAPGIKAERTDPVS